MTIKSLILCGLVLCAGSNAFAQKTESKYGNNVIAISPIQITNQGVGIGLTYETVLDKQGIISLTVPAAVAFSSANNNYYYYTRKRFATLYFMPGIKFYPTGSKKRVSYAVGPNLALAIGKHPVTIQTAYPHYYPVTTLNDRLSIGTMVFNYLDINPTEHLYLGLEMGMGVAYLDQSNGTSTGNMPFLFQLGFKLGYRF
jgi:hypothetical protein